MKNKLTAIRDKIADYANPEMWPCSGEYYGDDWNSGKEALSLLDEVLAEMDSMELVEKVTQAIGLEVQNYEQHIQDNAKAEDIAEIAAQAAINTIKGE